MNVMIDIIGSTIIAGMLLFTIFIVNSNLTTENYTSLSTYQIHTEMIQIARIIEFDLFKAGYRVSTTPKIITARENQIVFRADIFDAGTTDIIEYVLGDSNLISENPRDMKLLRIINSRQLVLSNSVTSFRLFYYDSTNTVLPTPVSAANLPRIKAVRVLLTLETFNPMQGFGTVDKSDDRYTGSFYEKLIYPRNL